MAGLVRRRDVSLNEIFTLVLPLVLPVVVGWALVQGRLAEPKDAKVLTTVFLWVCAPAELIHTLAAEDLADLFDPRLLIGTTVGFAVVYLAVFVVYRGVLGRDRPIAAFAAFSASGINALAIGLPVMLGLFGSVGAVPSVVATVIFLCAVVPVSLALAASPNADGAGPPSRGAAFGAAAVATIKNPIVAATVLGLALAALDVNLPTVVNRSLAGLGAATVVTALVALGMAVDLDDLRHGGADVVWLSVVRMVLAPAFALGLALLLGMSDVFSAAFVIIFAQPTAKTVFVLSEDSGIFTKPVSAIVTLTTVSTLVLLPVWILVCDRVWPSAFTG